MTMSCICVDFEKQIVLRTKRLMRVRKLDFVHLSQFASQWIGNEIRVRFHRKDGHALPIAFSSVIGVFAPVFLAPFGSM